MGLSGLGSLMEKPQHPGKLAVWPLLLMVLLQQRQTAFFTFLAPFPVQKARGHDVLLWQ